MSLHPAQSLSHYRILDKAGEGGMGQVYRARDQRLEREVAIKVLPAGALAGDAARARFRREALALSRLNHPNIEVVFDFDTQGGLDYLVMEFVPGRGLDEMLEAGPMPERDVLRLGRQLADGMTAAHEARVVHRDLKPGNIRVTPDGRLKILDFGLARFARPGADDQTTQTITHAAGPVGTLPYMAPEQLRDEPVDHRTDIYAAGAVLYEMLTGRRPFEEPSSSRLADAILHAAPIPPRALRAGLSQEIERVVLKCLEKDPYHRYQSACEIACDLRRLENPAPDLAAGRVRVARRPVRRAVLAGAALVTVAAVAVLLDLGRVRERWEILSALPDDHSVAVMPLANLSRSPEEDYFADGVTEAIINELARSDALRVISRTSVMRYKGTARTLPVISRELHVAHVVEGSVLRSGDRVRIAARLFDARTDRHLWAGSYETDIQDVLALQRRIADAIATEVRVRLGGTEGVEGETSRRVDPEAYRDYLQGLSQWNRRDEEGLRKSLDLFERSILRDPTYAPTYAGLADALIVMGDYGVLRPRDVYPRAAAAARRALELDEGLAEAHAALAVVLLHHEWDWEGAGRELERALELRPGYATGHQWYAMYLAARGRQAEALEEIEKARALDPLSLIITSAVGWHEYLAGQDDRAITQLRGVVEMDPGFVMGRFFLGRALLRAGRHAEAVREFEAALELAGGHPALRASLAYAQAFSGDTDEARATLADLEETGGTRHAPSYMLAEVAIGLGDFDHAFALLDEACEERDVGISFLAVEPALDPVRKDPRFRALLRRIGLAPEG